MFRTNTKRQLLTGVVQHRHLRFLQRFVKYNNGAKLPEQRRRLTPHVVLGTVVNGNDAVGIGGIVLTAIFSKDFTK